MQFLEEIAADLENRSKFESKLAQLGQLHENLGIPKQYLEVMGPIFCNVIRQVLATAAAIPSTLDMAQSEPTDSSSITSPTSNSSFNGIRSAPRTTTAPSTWSRDSKSAWLRFFRIIAFQMKRGYIGLPETRELDTKNVCSTGIDDLQGIADSDIQPGALQKSGSTDNSQYLLLHHPSTANEGSHKRKKILARHKMLAISGFSSGFSKTFDASTGCPMTGQGNPGPSSSAPYVISDSHAQRKAMFLKQYYEQPNRRVSVNDTAGFSR